MGSLRLFRVVDSAALLPNREFSDAFQFLGARREQARQFLRVAEEPPQAVGELAERFEPTAQVNGPLG